MRLMLTLPLNNVCLWEQVQPLKEREKPCAKKEREMKPQRLLEVAKINVKFTNLEFHSVTIHIATYFSSDGHYTMRDLE